MILRLEVAAQEIFDEIEEFAVLVPEAVVLDVGSKFWTVES